jgi:RNA 3'-terminal phosphate cyclase-like protein
MSSSSSSSANAPVRMLGCAQFRQRIVFATLSGKRLRVDGIRANEENPGLRDFEASFLRLVEALTNGCRVEVNETGTSLRYAPGLITGGKVEHDCGTGRSIGWFLEGILPLLPFAKKPTFLALTGVTTDDADIGVDMLRLTHLPLLPHFGVSEGLQLEVKKRGSAPLGGGLVTFACPNVRELK